MRDQDRPGRAVIGRAGPPALMIAIAVSVSACAGGPARPIAGTDSAASTVAPPAEDAATVASLATRAPKPSLTPTITLTPTPSRTPTPSLTPTPSPSPTPPPEASWPAIPAIDGAMKTRLRAIFDLGQARGHRPDVFVKVGDSNSASGAWLTDLGCGLGNLSEFGDLAPTVAYFGAAPLPARINSARCGAHNPFTRRGLAVGVGWSAVHALRPFAAPPPTSVMSGTAATAADQALGGVAGDGLLAPTLVITDSTAASAGVDDGGVVSEDALAMALCVAPSDIRLRCEIALTRPSIALVMFGTNDLAAGVDAATFRHNLGRIAEELIGAGVIPVFSTIPPRLDNRAANARVSDYNQSIQALTMERGLPLWNYWVRLYDPDMVNRGMAGDGIHMNHRRYGADFSAEGLRYGHNRRSLDALQLLDKLRRIVIEDGPAEG